MKFFIRSLLPVLCLLAVSACGQKGKLVIPVRPPAISTPYPQAEPQTEATPATPALTPATVK